jgi:predicted aspartyl protease
MTAAAIAAALTMFVSVRAEAHDAYARAYFRDGEYRADGYVGNQRTSFVIDTGSTLTMVNSSLLEGLKPYGSDQGALADGTISTALVYFVPQLCIGNLCLLDIPVLSTNGDNLIGTDLLHLLRAKIEIDNQIMVIHGTDRYGN